MSKSKEFIETLEAQSEIYLSECLAHTKQHATGSGKVVDVQDRHIPTVDKQHIENKQVDKFDFDS